MMDSRNIAEKNLHQNNYGQRQDASSGALLADKSNSALDGGKQTVEMGKQNGLVGGHGAGHGIARSSGHGSGVPFPIR